MAVTRVWKVYGLPGHRQRESFFESVKYNFSEADDVRIIELENSDKTGTNEYTIIRITRNTSAEAESELQSQLYDGAFENSDIGMIEEIECQSGLNATNRCRQKKTWAGAYAPALYFFYIIITHYTIKRLDDAQNAWYTYGIKLKKGATRVAEVKENGRRKNSTS